MTKLASYHIPGAYVEDHAIDVPLDWRGLEPAALAADRNARGDGGEIPGAPETIRLFYRVLTTPENRNRDDLPLFLFLQGGPGGEGPRPTSGSDIAWVAEALKHFRLVFPDQRGTGRSNHVSGATIAPLPTARAQADYLKRFLASSIVKDFEFLRLTEFEGKKWTTLGQSYGGFLTLTYLSFYPQGLAASFTAGGIPHVPPLAAEVYEHTFPRMVKKTNQFYERYPEDEARVAALADLLAKGGVKLPDGSPFTVRRLQLLGSDFGMKPCWERMHNRLDLAFENGDGTLAAGEEPRLNEGTLLEVLGATSSAARSLYWVLQEFIYGNGETEPTRWAAEQEYRRHPEFAADARPLMFTGEAMFPWMFEEDPTLVPFKPAMDLLMEDTWFDPIYDEAALKANTVPLQAAVYFDDLYVDSGMQLDTLSRVGASHYWTTNEFEHDGIRGGDVFAHIFKEARDRGDLDKVLG